MDVGNWISGSSAFSKSSLNIWKFTVHVCWSPSWRILSITLLACEMSAIGQLFEHSLALPFFGTGVKTDLFQSCGHCWVFQTCWHIECSTFTALSFRIWNSSTGIPSPPLALFLVMLSKAYLTSLSSMSGSRWVITSLWLSGFFCHLTSWAMGRVCKYRRSLIAICSLPVWLGSQQATGPRPGGWGPLY